MMVQLESQPGHHWKVVAAAATACGRQRRLGAGRQADVREARDEGGAEAAAVRGEKERGKRDDYKHRHRDSRHASRREPPQILRPPRVLLKGQWGGIGGQRDGGTAGRIARNGAEGDPCGIKGSRRGEEDGGNGDVGRCKEVAQHLPVDNRVLVVAWGWRWKRTLDASHCPTSSAP